MIKWALSKQLSKRLELNDMRWGVKDVRYLYEWYLYFPTILNIRVMVRYFFLIFPWFYFHKRKSNLMLILIFTFNLPFWTTQFLCFLCKQVVSFHSDGSPPFLIPWHPPQIHFLPQTFKAALDFIPPTQDSHSWGDLNHSIKT